MKPRNYCFIFIIVFALFPFAFFRFSLPSSSAIDSTPATNLAITETSFTESPKSSITQQQKSLIESFNTLRPLAARSGAQRFAVILSQFNDQPTTRWSSTKITSVMSTLNDYWYNVSNGAITIDYTVTGWHQSQYNISNIGTTYDGFDFLKEAIQLGDDAIDFSQIDYVLVWVNDPNVWAGWSSVGNWYKIDTNEGKFNVGFSIVGDNPPETESQVWGRAAHEMGHAFGLSHTHNNYNSRFSLMALGYPSDLNIYSQLFDEKSGWFNPTSNQQVIASGTTATFTVRARYLNVPGDVHSLKVKASNDLYYMVEVVKKQEEDAWDIDEGVLIYLVNKSQPDNRECTDMDSTPGTASKHDCLWDVGQVFTDAANSITINVTAATIDGYSIKVINNAVGAPDLTLSKWGNPPGTPPPFESADIWVDSQVNGWGYYRHKYGPLPKGIGDEPWANHVNRLYARIYNNGLANAAGVVVKFYENIPIGAGAGGSWSLIGQKTINVNQGSNVETYVDWTPTITIPPGSTGLKEIHACVKVVIEPATGEIATSNNEAQENIDYFEVVKSSSTPNLKLPTNFMPLAREFQVGNPYPDANDIYVNFVNISEGWDIVGPDLAKFHSFNPYEQKTFMYELIPDSSLGFGDSIEASLIIGYTRVDNATITTQEEYVCNQYHLVPYGGFTFDAKTYYRGELDINAYINGEFIEIEGTLFPLDDPPFLFPADEDRFLAIEIVDLLTDDSIVDVIQMDPTGYFQHSFMGIPDGNYSITAYYGGSEILASTASITLIADLKNQIVISNTTTNTSLNFLWIILNIPLIATIQLSFKKRRKKKTI